MNVLKLIAIYTVLIATLVLAQGSEYAGLLYFVAAMTGMTLLSAHAKPSAEMETAAI